MYKIIFISAFLILLLTGKMFSQDVINPYVIREALIVNPPVSPYQNDIEVDLTLHEDIISQYRFETVIPQISTSGGYDGEYMISLKNHPWHGAPDTGPGSSFYAGFGFEDFAKTYSIEVVSFPFTINCFDDLTGNGCAFPESPLLVRELYMPDASHPYNGIDAWGNLKRLKVNGVFDYGTGMSGDIGGLPETLVSYFYRRDTPFTLPANRDIIPHTVLKFTVNIHCGILTTDAVVTSFSWIYDNTRGMMRCYPFYSDNNVGTSCVSCHDVMFVPQLVQDYLLYNSVSVQYENNYGRSENFNVATGGLIKGGTINYFPFNEIPNSCGTYFPVPDPNPNNDFFNFAINGGLGGSSAAHDFTYNHIFYSPYILSNTFLRNDRGTTLAGYAPNGTIIQPILEPSDRRFHQYFINRGYPDMDFSIINPSDKIIYNPSEVYVQPDAGSSPINVIFPSRYTFKTILGRYPSIQEVSDANNDPQNWPVPYGDLRNVPVPVNAPDLPHAVGTTNDDYPEVMWDDPLTTITDNFYKDERYGYYYIKEGATITVENCVKIFDARFEVNPGSTLIFNDHSQIFGYEDKNYSTNPVHGRYKIRGTGGAILRNFDGIQYVQNGDITQSAPLHYIALSQINAGNNVDPDQDQPTGDYVVHSTANVTFQAGSYIHLTNGFSVQSGGDFHAYIATPINIPVPCYEQNLQDSTSRYSKPNKKLNETLVSLKIYPNPSTDKIFISTSVFAGNSSIVITDAMGRETYRASTTMNNGKALVDIHTFPAGLYSLKIFNADQFVSASFVKE